MAAPEHFDLDLLMSEEEERRREMLGAIELEFDVEKFKESHVGLYLLARARSEAADAIHALKTVDPEQPGLVRELQNKVWVAEHVEDWLEEAIDAGKLAQQQLMDEEAG